ncbi:Hypothetical protein MVR_LOCUS207 [uncultured virus]|nr:Hypothetical protein MVR_LOCUS207 [uncultured virus]
MVYYVDNGSVSNITLRYYSGYGLGSYIKGKYYVRIYTADGTQHMAWRGELLQVPQAITTACLSYDPDAEPPARKKIVLINNEKPIDLDLRILDGYCRNVQQFGEAAVTNMSEITQLLGVKCTHVSIIESRLFKKTVRLVSDTDLGYLYVC